MAAIAQTIAVFDKSNKVVSTSKQLKNVFREAKTAYLERKAEIKVDRQEKEQVELRKAIKAMSIAEETESRASSRSQSRRHHRTHSDRPRDHNRRPSLQDHRQASARSVQSGHSSRSSLTETPRSRNSSRSHTPLGQFNEDLAHSRSAPATPNRPSTELTRRRTDLALTTTDGPRLPTRSYSSHDLAEVDMDLAYGEFHPELHGPLVIPRETELKLQQQELSSLVTKCKMLLDEANCAQHSVKALVVHLQKNPDAMAAVALTLAEISNIASKMAPGALTAMKLGAPGVFALLAAPEFLIAVGLGVGLTVVAFGGYKIIKRIKAKAGDKDDGMDEALDAGELDRIEHWRRGIADADAAETASVISTGTSVEGEFITPMAARSMGHLPEDKKDKKKRHKEEKKEEKKEKKHRKKNRGDSEAGTETSKGSMRNSKSESSEKFTVGQRAGALRDLAMVKVKKPSPLRAMFRSGETNSTAS